MHTPPSQHPLIQLMISQSKNAANSSMKKLAMMKWKACRHVSRASHR
jgi:hypothetical protein